MNNLSIFAFVVSVALNSVCKKSVFFWARVGVVLAPGEAQEQGDQQGLVHPSHDEDEEGVSEFNKTNKIK
jgi:hypothetical protein